MTQATRRSIPNESEAPSHSAPQLSTDKRLPEAITPWSRSPPCPGEGYEQTN
jgi:hypothetical protein